MLYGAAGGSCGGAGAWCTSRRTTDAEDAAQGSIEALRGLGDWTESPGQLRAFPYVEYAKHAAPMEFTRAVIDRERRTRGPCRDRQRSGQYAQRR